jgi:CHASE3 domain sensor protein
VTLQQLSWILLGAVLLVCFGLLLGVTWAIQALQPKLRQQAEERRRLNAEWVAVRAARSQRESCPRCGYALLRRDRYFTPAPDSPADDD